MTTVPVNPTTHAGPPVGRADEFDMYAVRLDLDGWSYALDDGPVCYGPGWWPFHRQCTTLAVDPTAPLNTCRVPLGRTEPTRVRLSPDLEHRSWRNEYVRVEPLGGAAARVFLRLLVTGQMVRAVAVDLDVREDAVRVPELCPPSLRELAAVKGRRALDLVHAARRERRRGLAAPGAVLHPGLRRQG